MVDELYENRKKNDILDKVNDYINKTIDFGIDDNVFTTLAPFLSDEDIDETSDFFKQYKITPNGGLNSDEYKTIAYLSLFYKEKIKYNIKEIERYVKFLGYNFDENFISILCLDKEKEYNCDKDNYITFDEYLKLTDKQLMGIDFKRSTQRFVDGFDIMFDFGVMK